MKKPVVFYSGNTWQEPGDVVTLSGDQLGAVVDRVALRRAEDVESDQAAYVRQYSFDHNPVDAQFVKTAEPPADDFGAEAAILQRTPFSVKCQLPGTRGIYKASLFSADRERSAVYINRPGIHTLLGDEGEVATPGGTIRATGCCICPAGAPHAVKLHLRNGNFMVTLLAHTLEQPYYAIFQVPLNMPDGLYEASLYNGYGDETCWSEPVTVTISAGPRSNWPKTVFNVKDFGAKGIGCEFNDMPAIIAALQAAQANGGGTVYLPRGVYTLVYNLVIPRCVRFQGDGPDKTRIVIIPYCWDTWELPDAMFRMHGDVEITGIDFEGTRMGPMFVCDTPGAQNIYIHNCFIFLSAFAGAPTISHACGNDKDPDELYTLVNRERNYYEHPNGCLVFKMRGVSNVHISDLTTDIDGSPYLLSESRFVSIARCTFEGFGSAFHGCKDTIIENNIYRQIHINPSGHNIFFFGNQISELRVNNRELVTTDCHRIYGTNDGNLSAIPLNAEGTHLRLKFSFPQNALQGYQLILLEGAGAGQLRKIERSDGDEIVLAEPFAVLPDSGTKVVIFEPRSNCIFFKNHLYNGSTLQFYGTQFNSIIDHNEFERVGTLKADARAIYDTIQPEWYLSFVNNNFRNPFYLRRVGSEYEKPSLTVKGQSNVVNTQKCMTVRNNHLTGGAFILAIGNHINDLVIQDNRVEDSDEGVALRVSYPSDGIFLIGNTFEQVEKAFVFGYDNPLFQQKNEAGDHRLILHANAKM